jgi:hypothetical protein
MLYTFGIYHIPRAENHEANALAKRASGYEIIKGLFVVREKPTVQFPRVWQNESAGSSGINTVTHERPTTRGLVSPELAGEYNTSNEEQENQKREGTGSRNNLLWGEQQKPTEILVRRVYGSAVAGSPNWRAALIACIKDPGGSRNRKVHRQVLKYTLIDDDLY